MATSITSIDACWNTLGRPSRRSLVGGGRTRYTPTTSRLRCKQGRSISGRGSVASVCSKPSRASQGPQSVPTSYPRCPGRCLCRPPEDCPRHPKMGAPCIFPACINRMFGRDPTQSRRVPSLPDVLVTLSARAGKPLWIPSDVGGLCCATPWGSKGYRKGHDYMAVSMADALWRWSDGGRLPIVVDAASCTLGLVEDVRLHLDEQRRSLHERLKIIDSITWCRDLLPRLKIQRKLGRFIRRVQ
jgi:hypothetical protein